MLIDTDTFNGQTAIEKLLLLEMYIPDQIFYEAYLIWTQV